MDIDGNNKVDGELIKQAKEIVNVKENTPSIANFHSNSDTNVVNSEDKILIEDDSEEPL